MLTELSEAYLDEMHKQLRLSMKARKRLRHESILLSALETKNNVRFDVFNEGAVGRAATPPRILAELEDKGLITEAADPTRIVLTAKGIAHVERREGILDEAALIDFLDSKYFAGLYDVGDLNDREKVIVLLLVAIRAFGEDQALDLRQDDATLELVAQITIKCRDHLAGLAKIKDIPDDVLLKPSGTEHPVSHLIRHSDGIRRKTKGYFRAPGGQKYLLDLSHDGVIMRERLTSILRRIYGETEYADIQLIEDFCRGIANNDAIMIFDAAENPFLGHEADDVFEEALYVSV